MSAYLREHASSLAIIGGLAALGGVAIPELIPDLPTWRLVLGGGILGALAGLCAVFHRFVE